MTTNELHLFHVTRKSDRPADYEEFDGAIVWAPNAHAAKVAVANLQTRYDWDAGRDLPIAPASFWTARRITPPKSDDVTIVLASNTGM